LRHVAILGQNAPRAPIIDLIPAIDAADQHKPKPPQEMAPPTVFMTDVFDKVDKLENQEVKDIVKDIDAAARESEPSLKEVTTCDLTVSPIPAPPAGTGVPAVKGGAYDVDLSPTEDAAQSDDESPAADPLWSAFVAATAAAKRAGTSVATAPAGDITEGREDVDRMKCM
jgi:hypothetical protein